MDKQENFRALEYHNGTKHPYGTLLDQQHRYQPGSEQRLFKIYKDLPPIPLPLDQAVQLTPGYSALQAIAGLHPPGSVPALDLPVIAHLLHYSAGITKRIRYQEPWGEIPFRAAAATGALYHIELYLVCSDLPGLEAGVYHYNPRDSALHRLRSGDYRNFLTAAAAGESHLANAPAALVLTDVFWRNAVKYQAREYRHAYWDSGTILANTLAMAASYGLPTKLLLGFVDEQVSRLLDLDPRRELVLELLSVGEGNPPPSSENPALEPLDLSIEPYSRFEQDLPAIRAVHTATALPHPKAAAAWRENPPRLIPTPPTGQQFPLKPLPEDVLPADPIEKVIRRRGSSRAFSRRSISLGQLSTIIEQSRPGLNADFNASPERTLTNLYLIANAVDDLPPGAYLYHPNLKALEQLKSGDFRDLAGYLALNQSLAADAAADIFFLADLPKILDKLGERGYRAAQLDGSIAAGRIYLSAYALGLGATGLTFFDDAVTEFFSPHAAGQSVMFLVAAGYPVKR
jgi:SagB-type dehydrogenase family enzyme